MTNEPDLQSLPTAHVRKYSLRWVRAAVSLAVLASLTLAVFVVWSNAQRGKTVTIHFRDGFGLKPGDPIRHRGIDVGRIERIELSPSLENVDVVCELEPSAEQLARGDSVLDRAAVGILRRYSRTGDHRGGPLHRGAAGSARGGAGPRV